MNSPVETTEREEMTPERAKYTFVQSLHRGLQVLDVLGTSETPLTCKEVAETISLNRTITHRLLRTLERDGFVTASRGRYQLSARTLMLGNSYLDHLNLRRVALPYMLSFLDQWANKVTIGTLSLFVPVDAFVTIAEQLWPPNSPLDIILSRGSRLPIDGTAAGRCVLAYLPDSTVVKLLGADRASALQSRFKDIREANGIDMVGSDETVMPGVNALSALIRDVSGHPVAALSVAGISLSSVIDRHSDLAMHLLRTADQIGSALR